jgi:hypothetical protein
MTKINNFVGSRLFFRIIVGVFVLQAVWIALSGRYPMAFDEDFHLGIIRLYAQHIGMFWGAQPEGANAFGAVARDPSYLYHFLMSIPYRFIHLFTNNQTTIVLWLRAINIALFASSLPLYRRLLARTGASKAIVNVCLAVFVLIPIVPLLAAQINYDNLLLPVVASTLLVTISFVEKLRTKQKLDFQLGAYLLMLLMLGSLIKYAFLPIAIAVFGYVAFCLYRAHLTKKQLHKSLKTLTPRAHWLLLVLLVLSFSLFSERYIVNAVRYHNPVPACDKVLDIESCNEYGPWSRDYSLSRSKDPAVINRSPLHYASEWFYGMWLRTFFAVDGPTTQFQTRGPFVVPGIGAIIFGSFAGVAILLKGWSLGRKYNGPALTLFSIVSSCYIIVLWLDEYREYLHTGQPVAINGRYLLPILPLLFVIGALSLQELFGAKYNRLRLVCEGLLIACLIWGGGALTYILRSNDAWYWSGAPQILYDVNHATQHVILPHVPGHEKPTQFLH